MPSCRYLPEVFGGAERYRQRLSRTLACARLDDTVSTSRIGRDIPAAERMDGVDLDRLRVGAPPRLGGRHVFGT